MVPRKYTILRFSGVLSHISSGNIFIRMLYCVFLDALLRPGMPLEQNWSIGEVLLALNSTIYEIVVATSAMIF